MKLRSAPINFIISISSLRLKIAMRMVLKTTSEEITTKTTVAIEPPILANLTQLPTVLIACWRSPENDGSLLGSLYFLYKSSVLTKLFNDCWLFNSFTETRSVADISLLDSRIASSVSGLSLYCSACFSRASSAEIYLTLSTLSNFSIRDLIVLIVFSGVSPFK